MKSDSGREHVRRRIDIFWFWWGCEEILRELVIEYIDGCSRGGEEC